VPYKGDSVIEARPAHDAYGCAARAESQQQRRAAA